MIKAAAAVIAFMSCCCRVLGVFIALHFQCSTFQCPLLHKRLHKNPPVHFVVVNDGNNSGNTDTICQAVPEQRPTGEASCLKMDTETQKFTKFLCISFLMQLRCQKGARRYHSGQQPARSADS